MHYATNPGIYLTSYKLFSTVNQKKVPNKTQILWEDPSNSCFSFPFPNLKRGGRYLVLIFLMFEINFTVPTFNYNQVIYYMNSKIFCIVHIVHIVIFWRFCYSTLYSIVNFIYGFCIGIFNFCWKYLHNF